MLLRSITKFSRDLNVSLPVRFEGVIQPLREAFKKEKGVNISKGETIGIALTNECKRLGIKAH